MGLETEPGASMTEGALGGVGREELGSCWVALGSAQHPTLQADMASVYRGTSLVFVFWPHCWTRGILVPQPGTKPARPAVEVRSLNNWTSREVPHLVFIAAFPANLTLSNEVIL